MASDSQRKAIQKYRRNLVERGLSRFEVLGLKRDQELIRGVARRLAEGGRVSTEIRNSLVEKLAEVNEQRGGIVRALRQSPLVGSELKLDREMSTGRKVDL